MKLIKKSIKESIEVRKNLLLDDTFLIQVEQFANQVKKVLDAGNKVIFVGNGGSHADSIHLAAEFVARYEKERGPLAAIALGANGSNLTAIGNDYSFDDVFSRELEAICNKGDLLLAISTSGNSKNVIRAIKSAKNMGMTVLCLTGKSGGKMKEHAECLCVPSSKTARIQEIHIMVGHILCELLESDQ